MTKHFLSALLVLCSIGLFHCSSTATTPTDGGTLADGGTDATVTPPDASTPDSAIADAAKPPVCQTLPAGATLAAGSTPCTTKAGLFTTYTVNVTKNDYIASCDVPETDLYKDQADFDKNEGTSTVPDVTVKTNSDYVRTAECASGSIQYTASPEPEVKFLFLWTKQK